MITFQPLTSQTLPFRPSSPKTTPPRIEFGQAPEPLKLNSNLSPKYPNIFTYYYDFVASSYPNKLNLALGHNQFTVPETVQNLKNYAAATTSVPKAGLPELKTAIANLYKDQLSVDPSQIFICSGSRAFLDPLFRVLDGNVLLLNPAWPQYIPLAEMAGKKIYKVKSTEGYAPSKSDLERAFSRSRAKILILNNPNNPTGINLNKDELQVIVDFCRKHGITIVSDECQIVYPGMEFTNIAALYPEGTVIVSNGPDKALGVNGYHIAWSIFPKGEKGQALMESLKEYTPSTPAAPVQWAVAQTLNSPAAMEYIDKGTAFHQARTQTFYNQLQSIGLDGPRPEATFNTLVSFKKYKPALQKLGINNDDELQKYLLENYGLGTVPGYIFGISQFDYNLRLTTSALDQQAFSKWMASGAESPIDINRNNHPEMFSAVDRLQNFITLLEQQQ